MVYGGGDSHGSWLLLFLVLQFRFHRMDSVYKHGVLFQWNANSLRQKCPDMRHFFAQYSFPILAVTEDRTGNNFRLSNYFIYSSSRPLGPPRAMMCVRKDGREGVER